MWRVVSAVLALLGAGIVYFINLLYKKRRMFDGLVINFHSMNALRGPLWESHQSVHLTDQPRLLVAPTAIEQNLGSSSAGRRMPEIVPAQGPCSELDSLHTEEV